MYSNTFGKEKISVIIPVYNTVPYLEKCLNSVCGQTYQNLEIICVDDGSTDGSEKIIDAFAEKDTRIIAIHKANGGESSARNVGLRLCTGDYITFVDCDDWLEPTMYEKMAHVMTEKELDLVACGFLWDSERECHPAQNAYPVSADVFGRRELFQYVYLRDRYGGVGAWIWCKLFKREILYENGELIEFDETLRFGADNVFFLHAAVNVKRAYYLENAFYHYYQRGSSTMHTKDLELLTEILTAYQRMIDFLEEGNKEREILPWLKRFKAYWASKIAEQAYGQGNATILQKCQSVMREYKGAYVETNKEYPERLERYQKIMGLVI